MRGQSYISPHKQEPQIDNNRYMIGCRNCDCWLIKSGDFWEHVGDCEYNCVIPEPTFRKVKNPYRVFAKRALSASYRFIGYESFMKEIYPSIEWYALNYKKETSAKKVLFYDKHAEECLLLPSKTRFSDSYAKSVTKLFDAIPVLIEDGALPSNANFIVLSIDPTKFNNLPSMYHKASKVLNSLLTGIRKKYPDVLYARTFETQKNGMLHVNLMLFGAGFIDKDWIMRKWSPMSESGWGVELKLIEAKERMRLMVAYITKYIVKTFNKNEAKEDGTIYPHRDTILGWGNDWRSYSMSRKLRELITRLGAPNTNISKWVRICCLTELEFAGFGVFKLAEAPQLLTYIENFVDKGGTL
jgi:hypothetical protein